MASVSAGNFAAAPSAPSIDPYKQAAPREITGPARTRIGRDGQYSEGIIGGDGLSSAALITPAEFSAVVSMREPR